MKRPLIVGNWKMHTDQAGAVALSAGVVKRIGEFPEVETVVCPPFVYLDSVRMALCGLVGLGAQNMYHLPHGAFTGEISTTMLVDLGCQFVILGHSERRHIFKETDADVNAKVHAALKVGLTPIVCVGEQLADREAGRAHEVIREQFDGSLAGISAEQIARVVLAYEPVWAIGTGRVATPQQAQETQHDLRKLLAERYNGQVAAAVRILYGGSVKPDNAAELLAQADVDGALVGGACLKAADFLAIIAAAAAVA